MSVISYKLWKMSFPSVCSLCGCLHTMKREYCEGCGERGSLVETTKKTYKNKRN